MQKPSPLLIRCVSMDFTIQPLRRTWEGLPNYSFSFACEPLSISVFSVLACASYRRVLMRRGSFELLLVQTSSPIWLIWVSGDTSTYSHMLLPPHSSTLKRLYPKKRSWQVKVWDQSASPIPFLSEGIWAFLAHYSYEICLLSWRRSGI